MLRFIIFFLFTIILWNCNNSGQDINSIKKDSWTPVKAIASEPVEINNSGKASTDIFSQESACATDDIYFFKEENELLLDNGIITCDLPKNMTGTWQFLGKDSLIINHPLGAILRFKILSINKKEMNLRTTFDYLPKGVIVTYTFARNN